MRTKFSLNLTDAELIVRAAHKHAHEHSFNVTIAVVDESGFPILVSRIDDASPSSFNIAIEKARSAALAGVPTKALEAMVKDRPGIATLGRVAVEGGLPILYKGQKVGGVGVSGVRSDQDGLVAEAGLKALNLAE